ncbi:MAG: MATE family efflux transporter [Emergencia sp.]
MENNTLMTSGTIWKELLRFAAPLVLGNLFQQLYSIVDSIVVGNIVGSNALAAVGASGAIIQLLISFCIGLSAGAGVVTSQYYGAENEEGVHHAVHTTLALSAWAGVILSVAGVLLTPAILRIMDTPEEVFDQAAAYMQVFFAGHFFALIYNMTAGILNAVGNSRRSLQYLVIAVICNIFLDIFFVGVLKTGVIGAALATDLSQMISCIFILRFLRRSSASYRIRFRDIRFYGHLPSRIIRIGFPTGIQNIVISLSNVVVQAGINSFGATVMAAYAAFNRVDGFILLPIMSMSMACTTFAGQNFGAGKPDRIRRGMKVSIGMSVVYAAAAAAVMLIFAPYIMKIFVEDQDVIECGIYMTRYMYPFYWVLGIFHVALGTLRGVGRTMEAMVMSLASLCAARIIWIWAVFRISHQLNLLLLGYPVTWALGALIFIIYNKKVRWLDEERLEL